MDIEKAIEFILAQQAQFAADIQTLKDQLLGQSDVFGKGIGQIQESQLQLVGVVGNLASLLERTNGAVGKIVDLMEKTSDMVATVAQGGAQTDERLNTLMTAVEKHLSEPDETKLS